MEYESQAPMPESQPLSAQRDTRAEASLRHHDPALHNLDWLIHGSHGLRAGWSVMVFVIFYRLFLVIIGTMAVGIDPALVRGDFSPIAALVSELVPFIALLGAVAMVALFEHRRVSEYNLAGPRAGTNFLAGIGTGFAALSVLVALLASGGWLHFGPAAPAGAALLRHASLWACAFLLVGCVEEGTFRCYLQYTFARGLNFWWALSIIVGVCCDLLLRSHGQPGISAFLWLEPLPPVTGSGVWGVYAAALLGLVPCFLLQLKRVRDTGFWHAAWVTSTLFGFVHTSNSGENWIGVFAAAAIGFVFCVSIWLTGSAWWAIGCHAAWDWAETFFYGTADSGFASRGHFLSTSPAGNPLWSGGTDGPEGSLLVLGVILLLLVALLATHGRKAAAPRHAVKRAD